MNGNGRGKRGNSRGRGMGRGMTAVAVRDGGDRVLSEDELDMYGDAGLDGPEVGVDMNAVDDEFGNSTCNQEMIDRLHSYSDKKEDPRWDALKNIKID